VALGFFEQPCRSTERWGPGGEAATLNNIGAVDGRRGDDALVLYGQPVDLREVGDRAGQATTLNNIGAVHERRGDDQAALGFFEQALPILREVGDGPVRRPPEQHRRRARATQRRPGGAGLLRAGLPSPGRSGTGPVRRPP